MEIEIAASGIFLEPIETLRNFYRVIEEKKSVVRAFYNYSDSQLISHTYFDENTCVLADGVNYIAKEVRLLCNHFVDEQESHAKAIPHSYENFPRTLAERFRNDAEHSLAPDIIAQYDSFGEDTMEKYKRLLANCAYWLNQMYMIQVPLQWNNSSYNDYLQGVTQNWAFVDYRGYYSNRLYWADRYSDEPGVLTEDEAGYPSQNPVLVSGFEEDRWRGRNKMTIDYGVEWFRNNDLSAHRVNPGELPAKYDYPEITWGSNWSLDGAKYIGTGAGFGTYSGLWVDNRAPFDGICKCFVIKNDTNHKGDWIGRESQYEQWEYAVGGSELCSNLYIPPGYEDEERPWQGRPGRIVDTGTNGDKYIMTVNGPKQTYSQKFVNTYNRSGDDWGRCNGETDSTDKWTYSIPSADKSSNYYHDYEQKPASAVSAYARYADARNELEVYAHEWFGFGLTDDPSIPVETTLSAHTKDFVIPKWDEIPELPTPEWTKYDSVFNWDKGSQYYGEHRTFWWCVVVVPIMDYRETLTTITIKFPEEE
jgi:hypothetical protein